MSRTITRRFVLACAALLVHALYGQRPAHYEHRDADLAHAQELFDKAKYGAALYELERVVDRIRDPHDLTRTEAEFLSALCAVRLFHNDAAHRLLAFIDKHPEHFHVDAVEMELFRYYFSLKKFDDALAWAGRVDAFGLAEADKEEFAFKRGYAHFQREESGKAQVEFAKVKDGKSIYAAPATYYTAHINYADRNYEAALEGFTKLKDEEAFRKVVPYYIAQIHFLQGRYDELLEYSKPLLAEPEGTKRTGDINRLAGEAYFRTGQYAEALPYLEKSLQRSGVERGDRYIAGYALYKAGQYKKAVDQFIQVVNNASDSLAQLSSYHMADCYIKLNERTYARNAFKKAYDLGVDPRITEDALFNHAKLSYELSFDPYNEAIIALRDYLRKYPGAERHDEAQEFLLDVFLRTRNYEEAMATLDAIKHKDIRLQGAYQKLAFDRGVELYEGRKFPEAFAAFERAHRYPVDPKVTAMAHYWAGESLYASGDLQGALRKYDDVRNTTGAYAGKLYEQAGYSMGYAFFKQRNYGEAATAFRRFVDVPGIGAEQKADALVRIGDCYFVTKELPQAVQWYDRAMAAGTTARDYAMYQKAVCLGLEQKPKEKIATLRKLLADRPNGQYAADAKYQLGEAYLGEEQDTDALTYYQQVINGHPNSPNVRQSMLKSALIHRRQGKADQALAEFKAVVSKYPDMESARDALAGVESIMVEQGRVAEYETYVKGLTFFDASTLDLDEKYFRSAELLYNGDKCDAAVGAFRDYLAKYPQGGYAVNARFNIADCLYRKGDHAGALPGFEAVIAQQAEQYMEASLFAASGILFAEGRWAAALDHFINLEKVAARPSNITAARIGTMRCLRELGRMDEAATVAAKVEKDEELKSKDIKGEAGLVIAKAALDRNNLDEAYTKYKALVAAHANAIGAEAKFHMAYVRYLQKRYADTETEVFDLMKRFPGYEPWKSKAFIVLGDAYLQLDDRFQARTTWQVVVENSEDGPCVATAKERLSALSASEAVPVGATGNDEITIPMPGQQ